VFRIFHLIHSIPRDLQFVQRSLLGFLDELMKHHHPTTNQRPNSRDLAGGNFELPHGKKHDFFTIRSIAELGNSPSDQPFALDEPEQRDHAPKHETISDSLGVYKNVIARPVS
jgi:hypothetical protein